MDATNSGRTEIKYFNLTKNVVRQGCPCSLISRYQISKENSKYQEFTTMRLVHKEKSGNIKNSLSLHKIHRELELNSIYLHGSGSSNILLSKVSFNSLITTYSGKEIRDSIKFDLRIPGANTEEEGVFSYDMLEKAYGNRKNLYAILKHFYTTGRSIANVVGHKHGHIPDYDPNSTKHDQYIKHTEQLLVAYLALPKAAKMLCNRLRLEIRGKYADVKSVKLYNMGLHMHSTKTCCAACEYSMIGLMNYRNELEINNEKIGFLFNFIKASTVKNEQLTFNLPKQSLFKLLITVTASEKDATHRKQPKYTKIIVNPEKNLIPKYIIDIKKDICNHIFTTMVQSTSNLLFSNLTDKSVVISGSKKTPGSQNRRIKKII